METWNRNTAIVLICTGAYLLLGKLIGFTAVTALVILGLGVYKLKTGGGISAYVLIGLPLLFLMKELLLIFLGIALVLIGYYFLKMYKSKHDPKHFNKLNLVESIRFDQRQWLLRNMKIRSIVSDVRLDLSLAIMEQKETVLRFQGVVGDIEIYVPEEIGLAINTNMWIGQTDIGGSKEEGIPNQVLWYSPQYATSQYQIYIDISYAVGNVKVRLL